MHETDDIGRDGTKTYASNATDEFGDLIGEEGEFAHVYDAMANIAVGRFGNGRGAVQVLRLWPVASLAVAVAGEGDAWSSLMAASRLTRIVPEAAPLIGRPRADLSHPCKMRGKNVDHYESDVKSG